MEPESRAAPAADGPGTRGPGAHATPPGLARRLADRLLAGRPAGPVLDPACGDGALLLAAWRVGRARGLRPEHLHGLERDPRSAEHARRRLARELGGEAGRDAARRIRCVDALDSDTHWPRGTAVLANPPWVSFSGRHSAAHPSRGRLAAGPGWPSLHGAFLERIARHVDRERTRAAVLLPASLCQLERYGPTRARVRRHARPRTPVEELGENAFPRVVEPAVLLELEPAAGSADPSPWPTGPRGPATDTPLLERLASFATLPPSCFADCGVHTGNAARELLRAAGPGLPGVREGKDLTPFHLGAPRLGLDTSLERGPERRFRYAALERYRAVPVLLRQTADRPIAARHAAPTYFRNTLLACTPPESLHPAFVVGVLNSTLLARWHRASFADARQRAFPQVKLSHLRRLPFPIRARAEAPRLHDRVVHAVERLERLAEANAREALETWRGRLEELVAEAFGEPSGALD